MEAIYERLGAPNARQLRIATLREGIAVSAKEAEDFVKNKTERQLFRPPQLSQGQTASRGMGEEYQADLIDLAVFGGSTKAVLAVLDPFHRKLSLEPLSDKKHIPYWQDSRKSSTACRRQKLYQRILTPLSKVFLN